MNIPSDSTGGAGRAVKDAAAAGFDVHKIRQDFPILKIQVHGNPLVYLDNAATTQKPAVVIEALRRLYSHDYSNIHRGLHYLSERSTDAYEAARERVRRFINAADSREIVFVRGTTEAINLVASSYGRANIGEGDEVLITAMEHHSNIVPWQMLCEERGSKLRVAPINDRGELQVDEFESLIGKRTGLVSLAHVSNALGTINPVRQIVEIAHRRGIPVLLDGAQAAAHIEIDVKELDCDFYAFSSHKIYGPTGVGVLYGKAELLEAMRPYQGGGDMIKAVSFDRTIYNDIPYKFEAGTPNIAGTIGLGAALDYIDSLGRNRIAGYEDDLLTYATGVLNGISGVRLIGTAEEKASILSFVIEGIHPHDAGTILDQRGIAVRTGHHCAQPLMERFRVPATVRASLAFYNTREEIDALAAGIQEVKEIFQ